jgi:bifunctional DNA-binding transcriptional regulator/antitoxin component of YhaV-PrlF toxin-antitoxin module
VLVRVLATGQFITPEGLCKALGLEPGTQLDVRLVGGKIIIQPVGVVSAVDALYGKYAESDFLTDLEVEHRNELPPRKVVVDNRVTESSATSPSITADSQPRQQHRRSKEGDPGTSLLGERDQQLCTYGGTGGTDDPHKGPGSKPG